MNILMMTTHLNTGGITSYLMTLSSALVKAGHSVTIVSSGGDRQADFGACGVELIKHDIRTKSELSFKIYAPLRSISRIISERKFNILHAHTRVTQVMGCLLSRWGKIPLATTCHGFFKKRLSRRIFPCWGQGVIAISPQVRDHLMQDFRITDEEIIVIPNGIDVNGFIIITEEERRVKRRQMNCPPGPLIGIIARLSDVKGHLVLIQAMSSIVQKFPESRLMIVGQGRMEQALKCRVKELDITEQVIFNPNVNRTSEYLSLFDVFVMPSLQEGLGLSVLEAQASGLPVVASRVGGLPNLIEDGVTGRLVPPGKSGPLADALIDLLGHPAEAREMGMKARDMVVHHFSSHQMAEETLAWYQSLIGGGNG